MQGSTLEDLFARYLADRDERPMEELVRRTRPRLLAIARRIDGGREADDCVQTAYLSLIHKRAGEMDSVPVLPWLITAVVRIAYGHKARRQRLEEIAHRLSRVPAQQDPVRTAIGSEEVRILRSLLDRLPRKYRDPVVLHYLEALPVRDVAALLELSPDAVKKRLQRARGMLKDRWNSRAGRLLLPLFLSIPRPSEAALMGGIVVKKQLAVAAVLVLVALTITLVINLRSDGELSPVRIGDGDSSPTTSGDQKGSADPASDEDTGAEITRVPPPVDLAAVDLDRDLHGVVVDASGAPIPGALLTFVRYPWQRASTLNMRDRDVIDSTARTHSATDGTFAIRLPLARAGNLRARAPGFAPLELTHLQAGERIRVTLSQGARVSVRVLTQDGTPVPDTVVSLYNRRMGKDPVDVVRLKVITDTEGTARFDGVPAKARLWIDCAPTGDHGSPSWIPLDAPATGETAFKEIRLPRARTIRGRVVDAETGEPIVGARVGMNWTQDRLVLTGADGRYALRGWSGKGVREVTADADGYGTTNARPRPGKELDFKLEKGGAVRGRIVDEEGRPLKGIRIGAIGSVHDLDQQQTSRRHTVSDHEGRFHVAGLRSDLVHELVLTGDGIGRLRYEFTPPSHAQSPLDLGDIRVPRGRTIAGVLLDTDGRPIPRQKVTLQDVIERKKKSAPGPWMRRIFYGNAEERFTDHLGRFRFPDQAPGGFTVSIHVEGHAPLVRKVQVPVEGDLPPMELRLARGRPFVVIVEDEDGNPLSGASVTVRHKGGSPRAITGADGRAQFVVQGKITSVGPPWLRRETDVAYLPASRQKDIPEGQAFARFVLERGARITGVVFGPDGHPLPSAGIVVSGAGTRRTIGAGMNGGFILVVPRGAVVDLTYTGNTFKPGAKERLYTGELKGVRAGRTDVKLRVRAPAMDGVLNLVVLNPEGRPVEGATVHAHPGAVKQKTGAGGTIQLRGLPVVRVRVTITHPDAAKKGWFAPPSRFLVPDGRELAMRFERGKTLTGMALLPGDKPAAGARVIFEIPDRHRGMAEADKAGRFAIVVPEGKDVRIVIEAYVLLGDTLYRIGKHDVDRSKPTIRLLLKEP